MDDSALSCVICHCLGEAVVASILPGSAVNKVGAKGLKTLISVSQEKKDDLHEHLQKLLDNDRDIYVHQNCRAKYPLKRVGKLQSKQNIAEKRMRNFPEEIECKTESGEIEFDFENKCFICSHAILCNKDYVWIPENLRAWSLVSGPSVSETILSLAEDVDDPTSELSVLKDLIRSVDLLLKNAKYHRHCFKELLKRYKRYDNERKHSNKFAKVDNYMKKIYKHIEQGNDCQWTLQQLKDVAKTDNDDPVDRTILIKLQKEYGDQITIETRRYNTTYILFRNSLYDVLQVNLENKNQDAAMKEKQILEETAKILTRDVKRFASEYYSASDKFLENEDNTNEIIPHNLRYFLTSLIKDDHDHVKEQTTNRKRHVTSIAHSIISAVRPRSFIPTPQKIKDAIKCGYRSGCGTACSCRNNGGYCSQTCKFCFGTDCNNCEAPGTAEDESVSLAEIPEKNENIVQEVTNSTSVALKYDPDYE